MKESAKVKDLKGQEVHVGCKVKIPVGRKDHFGYIISSSGELYVTPGVEGGKTKDYLGKYIEDGVLQGEVTEYLNTSNPYMY